MISKIFMSAFFSLCLYLAPDTAAHAVSTITTPITAAETEVNVFLSDLIKTINHLEPQALNALYLNSEQSSLVVNGKIFLGTSTISQRLQNSLAQFDFLRVGPEETHIVILSPDQALVYYTFIGLAKTRSQDQITFAGATSLLLQKQAGTWKIRHEHTSPRIPG